MRSWTKRIYTKTLDHARKRGIEFNLTLDEFEELVQYSEGRCALTGIKFDKTKGGGQATRPFAPSIDRIDSQKGYFYGNIRLVCVAINVALNEWGETVFSRIASAYIGNGEPYESAWRKKRRDSKRLPGVTRLVSKTGRVKYRSRYRGKGVDVMLGTFDTEVEAHQAYESKKNEMVHSK